MDKHVLHKRSKDGAKKPEVGQIDYGEIAINYNKGNETFFIKNDEDEIVSLPIKSEDYVAKTGDTMTGDLIIDRANLSVGARNTFTNGATTGIHAFAQGYNCTPIALNSHAEGNQTQANGHSSHAEGYLTKTFNVSSHAEGDNTIASGYSSHAEGSYTVANNYAEHANGSYNVSIIATNDNINALTADTQATLFSIGNGADETTRRNAFEVKWNGDAYFSGDTKFAKGITANTISASNVYNSTDIDNKLSSKLDVSVYNNDKGDFASKSDLDLKADKSTTYTKTEVDGLIPDISGLATKTELSAKANTTDVYSKIDMNAELDKKLDKTVYNNDKPTFATKNDLNTKEDKGVAYSKADTDGLLADKANISDVYSKVTMDTKLLNKADVTYVDNGLNNKVDKETDKGLSSNDFTNTYKIKLDDLENYDDTAINTEISGKVAKTGDTITGDLNVEASVNIGHGDIPSTIQGAYSFAQGLSCHANGNDSHAEGMGTQANGVFSHAEGSSTQANGECSHAEGVGTIADIYSSHAEGIETQANGECSHSEGRRTEANGIGSHAEGDSTQAQGYSSHAEGIETQANSEYSHAEGCCTIADGYSSHAEGNYTKAIGSYSHAEGKGTIANNLGEHANGIYNVSISGTNQDIGALTADTNATLFSIGNGDLNNRRNAFEVKYNGDAYFSGDTKFAKGVSAETISATTITSPSLDNKQEILVSGTNIKTINGESLLGSGNIDIQGGGGGGGTAYTIGDGLQLNTTEIASNILSIKIDPSTQEFIYLGEKGLSITGVTNALEANVVTSVNQAIDSVTPLIKTAKTEAIDSAALDASTKANNAKDAAIAAASTDATYKVSVAKSEILSTASADASTKANNAKTEAIAAASTDATNKVGVAVSDLTTLITNETNRALGIEGGLRTDVNTKVSDVKLIQDTTNTLHYQLSVDGNVKGEINIPVNQFLKTADYDTDTNELVFVFAVESGDTNTRVFVGDLVDTYSAGNGLLDTSNSFSILIDPSSDSYLSVGANGLKLGGIDTMVNGIKTTIEGSINAIDTKINNEIDRATKAETANTESITNLESSLKSYIDGKFNEVTASINSLTQRIVALESNKYVLSDSIRTILPISSTEFEALPIKDSTILYTIIG